MTETQEQVDLALESGPVEVVTAVVHWPEVTEQGRANTMPPTFVVPGAGGDVHGAGLDALCTAVASMGGVAVRANLPYRERGARRPAPRAEMSVDAYVATWRAANALLARRTSRACKLADWVVGGKSYGGRVATLAVAAGAAARGLLLYSYPLHPPGKPERVRVDHWPRIRIPCLFLHGERDPFGTVTELEAQLPLLAGPGRLQVVAGGDHALRIAAKHHPDRVATSETAVIADLAPAIGNWLTDIA